MDNRARLLMAIGVVVLVGCDTSYLTAPHQVYAPLLDHAGQLDVSVRGGAITTNGMSAGGQVAYAPIDHLAFAATVDLDLDTRPDNPTMHAGGGAAIGTFVRDDVLRMEAFAGVEAGYAEGIGFRGFTLMDGTTTTERFGIWGTYVHPFVQGAIGFEVPYFEFAGGLRGWASVSFFDADGSEGSVESGTHSRGILEPFVTLRVPIDVVRIEVTSGLPMVLSGNGGPIPGTLEPVAYWYFVGGIGLQIDTQEPPFRDDEI